MTSFFAIVFCTNAAPQATSLTIDCQYPGWLTSYISPTDVQNIHSLTLTGTINSTDLATIGNLIKNYQLNKRVDLENVDIEGNMLSGDMFGVTNCQLQYLSLPLSVTKLESCVNWVKLDTLVCGSEIMPVFAISEYRPGIDAKCLILREGVSYYMYNEENSPIEEIIFPTSLKYIYELRGSNLSKINIPPAVDHLGPAIGTKLNLNGDTLYIPNTVKCLYDKWGTGGYRNGYLGYGNRDINGKIKCVYLPEGLDTLWISELHGWSNQDAGAKVDIHIKAKTPPRIENGTFGNNTVVYVPVGYKDIYKSTGAGTQMGAGQWGGATIIEEVYAERIDINSPVILYVGDATTLKAEFTPYNTTFKDVVWEVSDEDVLPITQNGVCTALRYGEVQVTATNADHSCVDTKTINVYDHTTGVIITAGSLKLKLKEKATLIANTLPFETSDGKVTWSSDDELVATVDENGNVRGIGFGTCTITATSVDGGYSAKCVVTVTQPVEALALEKHSVSLKVGESAQLFAQITPTTAEDKTLTWSSSDEQIAIVDDYGIITALKSGEVWIIAVSQDNTEAKDSCKVIVIQPVTGIQLNYKTIELYGIGENFKLKATIVPENASNKNIKWSSSNESVCVVLDGQVVAVGYGTCVIVANTEDGGYIATCIVTNYPLGDVNRDGIVNIIDVISIVNHILGQTPNGFDTDAADVNRDGKVDIVDVTCTLDIILKSTPQ